MQTAGETRCADNNHQECAQLMLRMSEKVGHRCEIGPGRGGQSLGVGVPVTEIVQPRFVHRPDFLSFRETIGDEEEASSPVRMPWTGRQFDHDARTFNYAE